MSRLLEVNELVVVFRQSGWRSAPLRAVDGVTFHIDEGETVGLVGESGSGKSTIGRAILGLVPVTEGSISFAGKEIANAGLRKRRVLARDMQVVFQDPYGSFDPTKTIGYSLTEPLRVQGVSRGDARHDLGSLLGAIGMSADVLDRFPSEFSGGQRQRLAIARALSVRPRLAVCDEPISSLDLSTQAQVLNLLRDLRSELKLAYLFVAHDLIAVRHLSDRVVVLYRGRVMESGAAAAVCDAPLHPYSIALWAASPEPDPARQARRRAARLGTVSGNVSASVAPPSAACPFAQRCPCAAELCWSTRPGCSQYQGRTLACHLFSTQSGHPGADEHLARLASEGDMVEEESSY
jgi:oligopeptide/dipeptide ABC transporter ATP-binding protein